MGRDRLLPSPMIVVGNRSSEKPLFQRAIESYHFLFRPLLQPFQNRIRFRFQPMALLGKGYSNRMPTRISPTQSAVDEGPRPGEEQRAIGIRESFSHLPRGPDSG